MRHWRSSHILLMAFVAAGFAHDLQADEIILRSGLAFNGRVRQSKAISSDPALQGDGRLGSYKFIDLRYKYYFVPNKLVVSQDVGDAFRSEIFELRTKVTGRSRVPDWIGAFSSETPFDEFGVREVTLETPQKTLKIIQGIKELRPEYVWVKGLSHRWDYGIATTSIEPDVLNKILRTAIDSEDPHDCLAVCRFLIEAQQFALADVWITQVEQRFPAFEKQCQASKLNLRQAYATTLLNELIQRKTAGQHNLVRQSLARFPRTELPTAIIDSVDYLLKEYEAKQKAIDTIKNHLRQLEGAIDPKVAAKVRPLREELEAGLGFSSLDRLQAYINLSKDKTLKPEERLAVAYSGWILGAAAAKTNLQETLGLAESRQHIAAYLGTTDPLQRRRALDEIKRLEGASPRAVAQLLSNAPPRPESVMTPGEIGEFVVSTISGDSSYQVVLPPEYSPFHDYPMIVALRQASQSAEDMLTWWCGTRERPLQAPRRGYIVIAPEYLAPGARTYESNPDSHARVVAAVRDAMSRFSVDCDRVFLTGHGTGGDATFDIAMSHPDVFAGAIPFVGIAGPECNVLYQNGTLLPWYIVSGQRHRDALAQNGSLLDRIARRNEDVIVCEYRNRGFESFYSEIHNVFDWMGFQERKPMPAEFEAVTIRPEDNTLFWVEAFDFPEFLDKQHFAGDARSRRLRNVEFSLRVSPTNAIQVRRAGSKEMTLRLMDGVVDFSKPIRLDGRRRGQRIDPAPAVDDVLEDYRIYRDRSRIALQRAAL